MSKPIFISTPEQSQAASPNNSVWVAAHAGSGKTHVLVDRVIRLMLAGAEPETILCLTFTRAAAAEMQRRLFDKLSQWTLMDDTSLQAAMSAIAITDLSPGALNAARKLFTRALETPGGLRIQTIHAFAEKLLRLFPVEAGIAPGFKLLEEHQRRILLDEARFHVMHQAEQDEAHDLNEAFQSVSARANAEQFDAMVHKLLYQTELVDAAVKLDLNELKILLKVNAELDPHLTVDDVETNTVAMPREDYDHWARVFDSTPTHGKLNLSDAITELLSFKDKQQVFQALQDFYFTKGLTPYAASRFMNTANQELYPEAQAFFMREQARVATLAERHALIHRTEASASLLYLTSRVHLRFELQKQARGAVDFDDIIALASKLVDKRPSAQWVLYKLDRGLRHLLVDEAQDTNPAQWRIILALAEEFFAGKGSVEEKRTVFVVGDRKQSIYSFQGADAREFERVRAVISDKAQSDDHQLTPVALRTSYRSVPEVLNFVDHIFPADSFKHMGFQHEEEDARGHTSHRPKETGIVEVWPTVFTVRADEELAWDLPIDLKPSTQHQKRLARKIAQVIESWIGTRRFGNGDVVKPGDILVLFRRRKVPFTELIAELRKLKVPVTGADRLVLGASLAVQDLICLGQALLLPDDDLSLATVLKSWCVPEPITEDELIALAGNRRGTLWQELRVLDNRNFQFLLSMRNSINVGPYVFFANVMQRFRHNMLERLGPEAGDATDVFLEFCLEYEQTQGTSIAGFLAWLQSSEIEFRREMSEVTDQVRLMTVHGAKGLEARIVILAETVWTKEGGDHTIAFKPSHGDVPALPYWDFGGFVENSIIESWKDDAKQRDQEETMRLLYVAMTRARDELYIAGSINNGKPAAECWKSYVEARVTSKPALNMREAHSEFFDEPVLRYGRDPDFVEHRQTKSAEESNHIPDWALQLVKPERGQKLQSVTGLVSVKAEHFDRERLLSMKRGQNSHLLLHELARLNPAEWQSYATRRAAKLGLSPDDAIRLLQVLKSEAMQPFLSEGSRGEVEAMLILDDQQILGRVDRLAVTTTEVLLLDYKTGSLSAHLNDQDRNVQQLGLYAAGLKDIYPNHHIRACLLWTDHGEISWIPNDLLSQACERALTKHKLDS